jgi:toxin ParE1/3/4
MSRFILTRPEAEADIAEAYRWYESRREGLGAQLLICLDETFSRITDNPLLFPVVHKDVRRAIVRRFP